MPLKDSSVISCAALTDHGSGSRNGARVRRFLPSHSTILTPPRCLPLQTSTTKVYLGAPKAVSTDHGTQTMKGSLELVVKAL